MNIILVTVLWGQKMLEFKPNMIVTPKWLFLLLLAVSTDDKHHSVYFFVHAFIFRSFLIFLTLTRIRNEFYIFNYYFFEHSYITRI